MIKSSRIPIPAITYTSCDKSKYKNKRNIILKQCRLEVTLSSPRTWPVTAFERSWFKDLFNEILISNRLRLFTACMLQYLLTFMQTHTHMLENTYLRYFANSYRRYIFSCCGKALIFLNFNVSRVDWAASSRNSSADQSQNLIIGRFLLMARWLIFC